MLQWMADLQEQGKPSAWLTLDEADNDTGRFLSYLVAAFRKADPTMDLGNLVQSDFRGESLATGFLLNLLERLESSKVPFTVFLDDFETIKNAEVNQILRQVLDHLQVESRLVIGTRETPRIGLARMRIWGQLVEIGTEELRFAVDETERFLREGHGLSLDEEDVTRLHKCAEGWAAGLQLAALSLAGRRDGKEFIRSFSGSSSEIADYLAEDVLSRQPEDVRTFLLQTSILNCLSGTLCDALTGRSDGYEMLSFLERANLFLTPLDNERCWYRYHNLFEQFLRSRLRLAFPRKIADLHRAAAGWFSGQGRYVEAAEHALAAGDTETAADLIEKCAGALVEMGQFGTVADWVERLPPETLDQHPSIRVAYAWTLIFQCCYDRANAIIDQISCDKEQGTLDLITRNEVNALRSVNLALADRIEESYHVAQESLAKTALPGTFAHANSKLILGFSLVTLGRFDEAYEMLRRARESHTKAGSILGIVYCHCFEGMTLLSQGRLQAALFQYRTAFSKAREVIPGYSRAAAVAAVFLAEALYELNELAEAERLLTGHLEIFREYVNLDTVVSGYITLGRILFHRGQYGDALRLLEEAERVGLTRNWPRMGATVRLERARLALQCGNIESAERLYRLPEDRQIWKAVEIRIMPSSDVDTPEIHSLRLLIRRGQAARALEGLRSELSRAEGLGRQRRALKIRILQADAMNACGDRKAALRVLREAALFAAPEGYIRVFADEDTSVAQLIRDLRESGAVDEGRALKRTQVDYLGRILLAAGETVRKSTEPDPEMAGEALDEITTREIEVIGLLARGLSNHDLAEKLFVSENTVKFHLRNINSKLSAKNRTEAVAKARGLGLIS
jgi:LuxR family maltose regulon positive regulatory protein